MQSSDQTRGWNRRLRNNKYWIFHAQYKKKLPLNVGTEVEKGRWKKAPYKGEKTPYKIYETLVIN